MKKITIVCAFLFLLYFSICYGSPESLNNWKTQQNDQSYMYNRGAYVQIAKLPGIVCYYAKNGQWPDYPQRLRELVHRFARFIFSMSDESIRYYCRKINVVGKTTRRPFFSLTTMTFTRDGRTTRMPTSTSRFQTSTTRFSSTRVPSTSTTTRTPSTSTTTSTTSSITEDYNYGDTATATGTGTATATGSATGNENNTTSNLKMPNKNGLTKISKFNQNDIVVPFPMNRQRLRKISF